MMINKSILLVVLIILAAVLGYSVYTKVFKSRANLKTTSQTSQPTQNRSPQATISATQKPPWLNSLSKSDQALFNTPAPDAAAEVKQKFLESLRANAKSANQINLQKNCQPQPLVFVLGDTLTFKIKNSDTVAHGVRLSSNIQHLLSPGETSTIKLDQARTQGFGCDLYGVVGFLVAPL